MIDVVMVMYYGICLSNVYWGMKAFLFPLCSSLPPFLSPGNNDIWRFNMLFRGQLFSGLKGHLILHFKSNIRSSFVA